MGAAIGYTPQQVNEMSMWQFRVASEGWVKANSSDGDGSLSKQEKDELWDWLEDQPPVPLSSRMVH